MQNDTITSNSGVLVGTNNYNFVWEHVVAHGLGSDVAKAVNHQIGMYYDYNRKQSKVNVELDHINSSRKIIVDSKYYNNPEEETIDYKRLYYNYHQAYLTMKDNLDKPYSRVLEEYKEWKNVLIKPIKEDTDPFSVFILKDNMKLYSLKVNTKEYIFYYVDNAYKSKLSYEAQEYLDLEAKVLRLNIAEEL